MKLPSIVKQLRDLYVVRFPVPQGDPSDAFEETARQWSIRFAQQVAAVLNRPTSSMRWGMKSASATRPVSKDTLSALTADNRLLIWDLLTGTGTGRPTLNDDPDSQDVTGQVFIEVTPFDYLGYLSPNTPPADQPPTPPVDPLPPSVGQDVAALRRLVEHQQQQLDALAANYDGLVRANVRLVEVVDALSTSVADSLRVLQATAQTFPNAGALRSFGRTVGEISLYRK